MEENRKKKKSFRQEDMVARRIFLRSYPLRWKEEEEAEGEEEGGKEEECEINSPEMVISSKKKKTYFKVKALIKGNFMTVFQKGGRKLLLLRKLKNKVAFYLVACHPFGLESSTKFITA